MTPTRKVVLLRHSRERDDLAAQFVAANGLQPLNVHPAHGDRLPDPHDSSLAAAIVYGGLESANDSRRDSSIPSELAWIERWLGTEKPYFGICLGGQMLAKVLGSRVSRHAQGLHEVGYTAVQPLADATEFLPERRHFYQWHNEAFEIPAGCRKLASGEVYENQAFVYHDNAYGVQFHPEVTRGMLRHWLHSAGHLLADAPGAQPPERQLRDEKEFTPTVQRWLHGFLRGWLNMA